MATLMLNILSSLPCTSDVLLNYRGHRCTDRQRRSALFIIFTIALLLTHVRLIVLNMTTVESLSKQRMKEREKAVLARQFSWYQFG